jgi:benzoyl-CoA reductase subunit B
MTTENSTEIRKEDLVGRGARDGAKLFREWFSNLTNVAEAKGDAAYVFVMGSMNEVLKSFDLPVVFPEVNALQTAIRRTSDTYLNEAEDYGYSPDICGYVKADVAMQLRGGEHPMGTIPKPTVAVLTNACNTYIKWAEIWERMYEIPIVTIDIPGTRSVGTSSQPGDEDFTYERQYVVGQIKELIGVCEKVTGKKFDIDKFRECLGHANEMSRCWHRVIELNQNSPAVFSALADGTIYLGMANCFRAMPEGAAYFKDLVKEMSYRTENDIGILNYVDGDFIPAEQRFRLAFVGVPCYPIFRRFNDLFAGWGGVFVASTYLSFAGGGTSMGYEYDIDNPIESLASGTLISVREAMDSMFHQSPIIEATTTDFKLDGIVYHPIKSCRTVSTGLADRRYQASEKLGLATLFIESDMMDQRVVSEAQMRNRVDAFFEGLVIREQQKQRVSA